MRSLRLAPAFLVLLLSVGCASSGGAKTVTFTEDARTNLAKGREAQEGKEAELLLADLDFARERFTEARDRYQAFVKAHPSHASVDYAAFRAAETYTKEMPSEVFFLPPASEKDQVEVKGAFNALGTF